MDYIGAGESGVQLSGGAKKEAYGDHTAAASKQSCCKSIITYFKAIQLARSGRGHLIFSSSNFQDLTKYEDSVQWILLALQNILPNWGPHPDLPQRLLILSSLTRLFNPALPHTLEHARLLPLPYLTHSACQASHPTLPHTLEHARFLTLPSITH